MAGFTELLTSFLFDAARETLKHLLKTADEKKKKSITEEDVRRVATECLQQRIQKQDININISLNNVSDIIREVYALAEFTNRIEVRNNIINIDSFEVPDISELNISHRIDNIKSDIKKITYQEMVLDNIIENPITSSQNIAQGNLIKDTNEIVSNYKKRIQSILQNEE